MSKRIGIFLCLSLFIPASFADNLQLANLDKSFQSVSPKIQLDNIFKKLDKRLRVYPKDHEAEFLKAVLYFKEGKLQDALDEIDLLLKKVPDFRLAHLLQGDLLLSKFGVTNNLGQTTVLASLFPKLAKDKKQQLNFLHEEARLRLQALLKDKRTHADTSIDA